MDRAYGEKYAQLYREHWWWRSREEYLVRLLERLLGNRRVGDILDFGCGDGLFFSELAKFGEPWGIETDTALLSPGGHWYSRIRSEPLTADPVERGRYGLILALDVLEHIEHPQPIVRELRARLKPGGLFVATVPAFTSMWTAHDDFNQHFKRYRVRELERLMLDADLEIVESRYLFTWLAFAKWLTAAKETMLGGKSKPEDVPAPWLNKLVLSLCRTEQSVLGNLHPPFGSSAIVVARAK